MEVKQSDSLEFLKNQAEYENDIIFADPPYALGSEVIIRKDGKVDYAKATDFMSKWEMPTGEFWEKWFIEAYRTLKHGGYLIMYGMDRQTLLFKYYASLSGFQEQQSIYWYFISNFPKATDLSKMIDKNAGAEREVIGKLKTNVALYKEIGNGSESGEINITEPSTELAKKYDGYKYSVAPLKQTCETIMVFKKPNKTGSVLHDTLAMENGDTTITCSALNIDGNRVGTEHFEQKESDYIISKGIYGDIKRNEKEYDGRYPAQTFVDSQIAEKLDLQSGVSGGGNYKEPNARARNNGIGLGESDTRYGSSKAPDNYGDIGGCSKILHKCDYEQIDFDLFIYEPKVDSGERNNGLDEFEDKIKHWHDMENANKNQDNPKNYLGGKITHQIVKNNHPTLKPIDLNCKILKLFKTPNEQRICYPFAGSGSEIIGGLKANFQNWTACEINADYVEIANARIKHYKENEYVQLDLFGGE